MLDERKEGVMPTVESVHTRKLKSKAKQLLKSVKASEQSALNRIEPYFSNFSDFKLTQAQLVIARELHLNSWRELIGKDDWKHCSFCKKWQYEVLALIAGPDDVCVCDECVDLCNGIIQEQRAS